MTEIQSLGRGLRILDILGQSQYGASITELARTLHVDKGTASRLVSTLVGYGYAEKDEFSRRYHLGSQVVRLSRSVITRLPLREAAKSLLRDMMERTGECAHLAVLSQGKALYIDQVESPATLRVNAQVGTMNPLHCTALGKTLLAFCGADFPTNLERYTTQTITDPKKLLSQLERIKSQGYALDDQEFDLGVRCISAPVFDFRGKGVGSIGISGPATRVTTERVPALVKIVKEIAKELSGRMLQNP